MNRQALAFLTMFSLILMLSVYYVTLPNDTTTVMSTESGENLGNQAETNDDAKSDAEKLQEEITSKQAEEMKKQSDIVSSADSSDAQKQEALETIDTLKSEQEKAKAIQEALADVGFMSAVEISEGTCRINIFDSEDHAENAQKVMDQANTICENKYLIEVTFK